MGLVSRVVFVSARLVVCYIVIYRTPRCETGRRRGGRRMEWGMSYSGPGFRPSNVPVEEGKVYEAKIEDIGREGDGLARIQNFVVFVPGTKVGDQVKIRITKVHRRMAFGEVLKE